MEISVAFEDKLNTIVTDVAKRFGYSEELQNTLIGVVSKLCKDKSEEDKGLYLEVIKKTPIKLVPKKLFLEEFTLSIFDNSERFFFFRFVRITLLILLLLLFIFVL